MLCFSVGFLVLAVVGIEPVFAAASRCLAIAGTMPGVRLAAAHPEVLKSDQVRITFAGHSTFRIESARGVIAATDYAGYAGQGRLPDIVTMNRAHETHYTDYPDPKIKHVLRGWNPKGGPAEHLLKVRDMLVRNVTTDIRIGPSFVERHGNSIFIFEVANLCIGHLGHLQHKLKPRHIGLIGQLDILMVPVDGSFTMDQQSMIEVIKSLKARLILPMHYFGAATLNAFVAGLGKEFDVEMNPTPEIVVSETTLPKTPKVLVLPGF